MQELVKNVVKIHVAMSAMSFVKEQTFYKN